MTAIVASNVTELKAAVEANVERRIDAIHPDDYARAEFYQEYLAAWKSVTVWNDAEAVYASVSNRGRGFGYIAGEALDVDASEKIFNEGHILDVSEHVAKFVLKCENCVYDNH